MWKPRGGDVRAFPNINESPSLFSSSLLPLPTPIHLYPSSSPCTIVSAVSLIQPPSLVHPPTPTNPSRYWHCRCEVESSEGVEQRAREKGRERNEIWPNQTRWDKTRRIRWNETRRDKTVQHPTKRDGICTRKRTNALRYDDLLISKKKGRYPTSTDFTVQPASQDQTSTMDDKWFSLSLSYPMSHVVQFSEPCNNLWSKTTL